MRQITQQVVAMILHCPRVQHDLSRKRRVCEPRHQAEYVPCRGPQRLKVQETPCERSSRMSISAVDCYMFMSFRCQESSRETTTRVTAAISLDQRGNTGESCLRTHRCQFRATGTKTEEVTVIAVVFPKCMCQFAPMWRRTARMR